MREKKNLSIDRRPPRRCNSRYTEEEEEKKAPVIFNLRNATRTVHLIFVIRGMCCRRAARATPLTDISGGTH